MSQDDIVSDPHRIVSEATDLIVREEGTVLRAYPDPASALAVLARKLRKTWQQLVAAGTDVAAGRPWTIGCGDTAHADGSPIGPNDVWTLEQAKAALSTRVMKLLSEVGALVQVPLPDEAYAALMSLAYNCGIGVEERSIRNGGLLSKLNSGDYAAAANDFGLYVHAQGVVNEELVGRRLRERQIFVSSCQQAGLMPEDDAA